MRFCWLHPYAKVTAHHLACHDVAEVEVLILHRVKDVEQTPQQGDVVTFIAHTGKHGISVCEKCHTVKMQRCLEVAVC